MQAPPCSHAHSPQGCTGTGQHAIELAGLPPAHNWRSQHASPDGGAVVGSPPATLQSLQSLRHAPMQRDDSDDPRPMMPASGALASSYRTKPVRNQERRGSRLPKQSALIPQRPRVRQSASPRFRAIAPWLEGSTTALLWVQEQEADQRRHQSNRHQATDTTADQEQRRSHRPGIETVRPIASVNAGPLAHLKGAIVRASGAKPIERPPRPIAERGSRAWSSSRCHRGYLSSQGG